MLEYGLIAGVIAVVCLSAISRIGPNVGSIFQIINTAASTALQSL